jgi:hypothetical protein
MSNPIHQMQRYILGGVGLVSAMGITFPIAMARVSQTAKFPGQAVISENCAGQPQKEPKVIAWAKDCAPLKVEPKKAEAKPAAVAEKPPEPIPETTAGKAPEPAPEMETLRSGLIGPEVMDLQNHLQRAGGFELRVDGVFGPETELAVQEMQQRLNLEPNGLADAAFQKAVRPSK